MVKDKPNSTRLYDEDGYRRRAACVCINSKDPNQVVYQLVNILNVNSNVVRESRN